MNKSLLLCLIAPFITLISSNRIKLMPWSVINTIQYRYWLLGAHMSNHSSGSSVRSRRENGVRILIASLSSQGSTQFASSNSRMHRIASSALLQYIVFQAQPSYHACKRRHFFRYFGRKMCLQQGWVDRSLLEPWFRSLDTTTVNLVASGLLDALFLWTYIGVSADCKNFGTNICCYHPGFNMYVSSRYSRLPREGSTAKTWWSKSLRWFGNTRKHVVLYLINTV